MVIRSGLSEFSFRLADEKGIVLGCDQACYKDDDGAGQNDILRRCSVPSNDDLDGDG